MHLKKRKEVNLYLLCSIVFRSNQNVDCEQSFFFFRSGKGSARARERGVAKPRDARRETQDARRETRDASNEGGSPRRK